MKNAPHGPSSLTFSLLRLLGDGEFHSGETMAQQLQVSRSGVNNALKDLDRFGLALYRVRGRGYRLANPPQWLDPERVGDHLGRLNGKFHIHILESADSTNTLLLQRASSGQPSGSVLAAEWQSGGRGRMGRTWHSALGNALTFSLLWRFDKGLAALSGLSLATGVALVRALRTFGIEGLQLKWPNDLLDASGAKLAGILIETQGDMLGPSAVVIGIGVNISLPPQVSQYIGQAATSLADICPALPERNQLLAAILRELYEVLQDFALLGFAGTHAEWETYHAHRDKQVRLLLPNGQTTGVARGVTDQGALKLETEQGVQIFHAGEISLQSHAEHAAA